MYRNIYILHVHEYIMKQEIKCKHCGSINFSKQGYRKTQNRGKIQKYYCNDGKKHFTFDDGFYRMRTDNRTIAMSIDMYLSNLSSRKMRNQLKRHFGLKISHQTILNWIYKYALKVHNFIEKLGYNLGNSFYADETVIKREGNEDRFWCCVDWDTRLITGIHYSTTVNPVIAEQFLKKQ